MLKHLEVPYFLYCTRLTLILLLLSIVSTLCLTAQSIDTDYFQSPVDHKLVLSGSFGELRTNHFHSGIDIKTSHGAQGDTIRAAAAGYVSRLKIEYGGYGKAIYINHPNGTTTVYAHMNIMSDTISSYLLSQQRKLESYAIDIEVAPDILPIAKGEYIAQIGNMGRSMGPHLHFEIRDTESEQPINPFLYDLKPTDKRSPKLQSVSILAMTPDFQINDRISLPSTRDSIDISAWRIGVSFNGYDQMDGAYNKNGVYMVTMLVDDALTYQYISDRFSFDESQSINAVIDYELKKKKKQTRFQCFKLPGNKNSMIKKIDDKLGLIDLFESKYRKVELKLTDFDQNETSRVFYIRRKSKMKEYPTESYHKKLNVNEPNLVSTDVFQWRLSEDALYRDCFLSYSNEMSTDPKIYGQVQLGQATEALNGYHNLSILIDESSVPSSLSDKLIILNTDTNTSYGGNYINGVLDTPIDKFGTYIVTIDTIPPTLELSKNLLKKSGVLIYTLKDNYASRGEAQEIQYDCYLNDNWIVGSYSDSKKTLTIDISNMELKKTNNTIKIKAWDDCNNTTKKMIKF